MTARLATVIILFFAATVVSGLLLALGVRGLPMLGLTPGPWGMHLAVMAGFLPVFLPARVHVLPPHLASPAWKATVILTMWIGATLAIWEGAMSLVRSVGVERGTFAVLLLCLLAGLLLVELVFAGERPSTR
jgi:hypothetical protein